MDPGNELRVELVQVSQRRHHRIHLGQTTDRHVEEAS
jgi:hypothetical protein